MPILSLHPQVQLKSKNLAPKFDICLTNGMCRFVYRLAAQKMAPVPQLMHCLKIAEWNRSDSATLIILPNLCQLFNSRECILTCTIAKLKIHIDQSTKSCVQECNHLINLLSLQSICWISGPLSKSSSDGQIATFL